MSETGIARNVTGGAAGDVAQRVFVASIVAVMSIMASASADREVARESTECGCNGGNNEQDNHTVSYVGLKLKKLAERGC